MKMTAKTQLSHEAVLWGRYFLHQVPNDHAIEVYCKLVGRPGTPAMTASDQKLLAFARRLPFTVGMIDSGLLTTRPHAELRRRLYVMFSILETDPAYYDRFAPQNRSPFYLLYLAFVGIRAVVARITGLVLVKVVG